MTNYKQPLQKDKPLFLYYSFMFIGSVLFLLLMGEIMVRAFVPKETYFPISNIFRAVDGDVGYTFRPNFKGTAFGVGVEINNLGFRGPDWSIEKDKQTFRIAMIGDSHAFGYGVSFKDTVGERIAVLLGEDSRRAIEVLNFGVNGHNSKQQLAVLRRYALKFKPDLLIVIPCNNDDDPALLVDKQGYLRTPGQSVVGDESISQLAKDSASWLSQYSRLVVYGIFLKNKLKLKGQTVHDEVSSSREVNSGDGWWMGPFPAGEVSEHLRKTVYIPLLNMVYEAKSHNIPIIVANFNGILSYRQLFQKLQNSEGIPSLELLTLFPEASGWHDLLKKYGLGWNNHLNASAHERWAGALTEIIKKEGYLEGTPKTQ